MKIKKFEDILAWKKSMKLSVEVYKIFSDCKDFSFKNQIERAVVSISNNIAEGFERQSNKEFRQFLYIAKGSSAEARSMLYLSYKLGYINQKQFLKIKRELFEISKMLSGFIKTL